MYKCDSCGALSEEPGADRRYVCENPKCYAYTEARWLGYDFHTFTNLESDETNRCPSCNRGCKVLITHLCWGCRYGELVLRAVAGVSEYGKIKEAKA